jgi:hypothetical protein
MSSTNMLPRGKAVVPGRVPAVVPPGRTDPLAAAPPLITGRHAMRNADSRSTAMLSK